MSIYVDKEKTHLPIIPETTSGKHFIDLLYQFYHKDETTEPTGDSEVKVSLFVSIRTTLTNKVLTFRDSQTAIALKGYLKPLRELEGYYLQLANIQELLRENLDPAFVDAMPNSVLQPIGFIETSDSVGVYFHIVVKDEYENGTFISLNPDKTATFEEISSVPTFTNLVDWTTMILPTLKIVGDKTE